MRSEKTVFMTGATGHMGYEGLKLLAGNRDILLKLLALPDRRSRKVLAPFRNLPNVEILEGDLTDYKDVRKGVEGADYVLHLGALIPPAADYLPELAERINLGGTLNIIKAIKEQDNADDIRLVYIGTVASMGDRMPPIHWVRTGDPIKVSRFDNYGLSKVRAERAVIESGLKHWVSLRQTGMLHCDILKNLDPIIFHQPVNNHMEWSSADDSGRILNNVCTLDLPEPFWRKIYNIGGGEEYRLTYFQFMARSFKAMGLPDICRILSPRYFTTKNFHGCWYSDSDILDKWLHFRKTPFDVFFEKIRRSIPAVYRLAGLVPPGLIRHLVMKPLAKREQGTLNWIENGKEEQIKAFWGNREAWEKVPEKWDNFDLCCNPEAVRIEHGYDESIPDGEISLEECRSAARFRGGDCLSLLMEKGNLHSPLLWKCGCGREFSASPALVLKGGHWCPHCDTSPETYDARAAMNPFYAQVHR